MKFQSLFRVCLIFYTSRELQKASGITIKNVTRYSRWPRLLQDVLNRRLLFKNKPAAVAYDQRKPSPSHFFVSGIGQKKTVDAAKICGGVQHC